MNAAEAIDWFQNTTLLGVSLSNLAVASCAALLAYVVMTGVLHVALGRLSKLAAHTSTRADDVLVDVLNGTSHWLISLIALLIGAGMLDLSDRWVARFSLLWFVGVALQVALWANRAVSIGVRLHAQRHGTPNFKLPVSPTATLVYWGLRTLLWSIAVLAILSNIGVNITAFVASLGVGGIAIALAAQNVLGDLFASMAIAIDKPFEVGDFIVLGSVAGSVEAVGIKTTRIRSLGGEQIVMSNTEMLKQTVSNYKRMRERRILFGFGVARDTTADQAAAIPALVRAIIEASDRLRFDRAHLLALGESALNYEVVYIVLDADYNLYMDEQHRINLALLRGLDGLGVGFAFPARTLHLVSPPGAGPADMLRAAAASVAAPAGAVVVAGPDTPT